MNTLGAPFTNYRNESEVEQLAEVRRILARDGFFPVSWKVKKSLWFRFLSLFYSRSRTR